MLDSSPIPSIPTRPVKKTSVESDGDQEPKIPKRPSRVSTSESLAKSEPTIPARPKKNAGPTENDKNSTQSDLGTKETEEIVELDNPEVSIPVVPSRRPVKSPINHEVDEPSVLEVDPVQAEEQNLDEGKAKVIEGEKETQTQDDASVVHSADGDVEDTVSPHSELIASTEELNDTKEDAEDVSSDHVVLTPSVPSHRPIRSTLEEASDAKEIVEDGPSDDNAGKSLTPTIPSRRPIRSTLEEHEGEEAVPIIPLRPLSSSRSTSSTSTPILKKLEGKPITDELPTSTSLEIESKLNSEVEGAAENENEADGDGDKTPGNTDTKTTFKSFEEDRPVSDSSSFNDDVETVLQEKDELENTDDATTQILQKEEDSKDESEDILEVEGNKVKDHEETDSVIQNPTVPKRPLKPEQKEKEAPIPLENTPVVHKAPPPKPKKLSSKMAAFQEIFNQKPPVLERGNSGSADTLATDTKEIPSVPKRPSKLSSDKVKFGNNLNLTGMMGGRGIALPGMVDFSLLKKATQDEGEEEGTEAESIEKTATVPTSDVRKGRAKGPKGKRLPKSITDTTMESSSRFSIVVENLWEISHIKNVVVEENLENSVNSKIEDNNIDKKISEEVEESTDSVQGLKESSRSEDDTILESKSTEHIEADKDEPVVSHDRYVTSDPVSEKVLDKEEIDDTASLSEEDKQDTITSGNVSERTSNTEILENKADASPAIPIEEEINHSDVTELQNHDLSFDSETVHVPEESKTAITDLDSLISQAKEDAESFMEDNTA